MKQDMRFYPFSFFSLAEKFQNVLYCLLDARTIPSKKTQNSGNLIGEHVMHSVIHVYDITCTTGKLFYRTCIELS